MHVDESLTNLANGTCLLQTTLEGIKIEHAIRLGFRETINEVEYEALIFDMNTMREAGACRITVYIDSKLVEG